MRFFSQVIVPRLCDFLLNKSLLVRHRRELLAGAYGDVLEIGFGTGLNLPYYPEGVHNLTAVDPNPGMHRLAQKRIKQRGIEVDQQVLCGERLPFEDGRFDCAPEPGMQKWQRRLNGLQVRLANGCHLDRDMKALVAAQPFASVEVEEFYLERTPRTHGYLYRGVATK